MLSLCGILKVNEYNSGDFNISVKKWDANVDLTNRMKQYLESLNSASRMLVENDVLTYLEKGPVDAIEIEVNSGESLFMIINDVVYKKLCRYLQADYRVVRVKFKFNNRLKRTVYTDTEESGDYLLIPVMCRTQNEEMQAIAWTRECIKSILGRMFKKYGNQLTVDETKELLDIK